MANRPAAPIVPMPWELDSIETSRHESITSADALSEREEAPASEQPSGSEQPVALAPPVALRNERIDSGAVEGIDRSGAFRGVDPSPEKGSQDPTQAESPGGKGGTTAGDSYTGEVCDELLPEAALGISSTDAIWSSTPLLDPSLTFRLHSNPTATRLIYLDFDGHTTTGTAWNNSTMGSSFYSPAYDTDGSVASFGSVELSTIQKAWMRVAADFAPFDVDITTQAPPEDWLAKSGSSDVNYGIRVVITSYGPRSDYALGIAMVGSYTSTKDTPAFVYGTSSLGICETTSHEVGHTLGLSHDGSSSGEYYLGHGDGETRWNTIMGGGSNSNVSTWDDGSYSDSNNTGSAGNYGNGADDLAVIVGTNGISYRPDLVGNDLSTATPLSVTNGSTSQFGTIETRSDTDVYSFNLLGIGDISLTFDPYWYRAYVDKDGTWGGSSDLYLSKMSDVRSTTPYPDNSANLDLEVKLYDSLGRLYYSSNDSGLATAINLQGLSAGTYYLKLDGVGYGDPTAITPTGYSDYASIGDYCISGTITSAAGPTTIPVISLSLSPSSVSEDGGGTLIYTFTRSVTSADPLIANFTVSGTATNGSDYSGLPSGSAQSVTFAANAATASIAVDPTADSTVEADETVSFMLAPGTGYTVGTTSVTTGTISNDDLAPVIAPLVFSTRADILTGTTGSDKFVLNRLSDALWSSTPDRITNLQGGIDTIDSPLSRTSAIQPKLLGAVKTLDATGIEFLLNSKNFVKNGASTFTFGSGNELRTFLGINDATPGFKANSDGIIEITGYSGNLSTLAIL